MRGNDVGCNTGGQLDTFDARDTGVNGYMSQLKRFETKSIQDLCLLKTKYWCE